MKNVNFVIEGMRCDGCAGTIKALVEKEPGAKAVFVSFEGSEARVLYDPRVITEDRLAAAIERPGYRATERR